MPHLFPALIAKDLSQVFRPSKLGLAPLDLTVDPGTIHVVVGHSGAGKTVLADILGGVTQPASGSIHLQGQLTSFRNVQDAGLKAVRYVKQNWDTHNRASVVDALDLGAIPRRFGLVDTHALVEHAQAHLNIYGLGDVDPKSRVSDLSIGKQKLLQIAAAVSKPAALLILDDPTAALTEKESQVLFDRLSQLQYSQTGVVYFTSRAQEAMEVGDQISVLRDGHLISTHDPTQVFVHQIAGEMLGRELPNTPSLPSRQSGPEVAIRIECLSVGPHIVAFSLKAKRGEVVGLLGLQGAGQSEVLKAMVGVEPRTDGAVFLKGSAVPSHVSTREQALASGVGFVSEPLCRPADAAPATIGFAARQLVRSLNSENPQKAPIAKCLDANCSVLLFDNPTRGLNIACRLEVHQAIQDIADQGVTVIAASTDVEELMGFCDRIVLMANGSITRTIDRAAFDGEKILAILKGPR